MPDTLPPQSDPLDLAPWLVTDQPRRKTSGRMRLVLHGLLYGHWHADLDEPTAVWEARLAGLVWGLIALAIFKFVGWPYLVDSQYASIFTEDAAGLTIKALLVLLGAAIGSTIVAAARRQGLNWPAPVAALAGMSAGLVVACGSWQPGPAWFGGLIALPPLTAWLGLVLGSLRTRSREQLHWLGRQALLLGATFVSLTIAYLVAPPAVPQRILGESLEGSPMARVFYGLEGLRIWDPEFRETVGLSSSDPKVVEQAVARLLAREGDRARLWASLQPILEDGDKQLREAAYKALGASGHPAAAEIIARGMIENSDNAAHDSLRKVAPGQVPRALELLQSGNEDDISVARQLIIYGSDAAAVPALIGLLRHPSTEIRGGACLGLGQTGDRRAVPALIEAARDPEIDVRHPALVALGEIGDVRALDVMIRALQSSKMGSAHEILRGLGRMRDPRAAKAILDYVNSSQVPQTHTVKNALEQMGEASHPALIEAATSPNYKVRELVVELLTGSNYPGAAEALARAASIVDDSSRRERIGRHYQLDSDDPRIVRDFFEALQNGGPDLRAYAEEEFGNYCARGHKEALEQAITHPSQAVRLAALRIINQDRQRVPIETLKPLLKHSDSQTRALAVRAVGHFSSQDAHPLQWAVLRQDRDATVRVAAVEAIGKSHWEGNDEELLRALRRDKSAAVRAAAARTLHDFRSERVDTALLAATRDKDASVRKAAGAALSGHSSPQAERFLKQAGEQQLQRAREQLSR